MVMECYEKGVLTKKDTDGLEMTWGNVDAVRSMLNKIAHRDGFGNRLAEGVMRAARSIGSQAPQFAIHTNSGTTPVGHDHHRNWAYTMDNCVSNTGSSQTLYERVSSKDKTLKLYQGFYHEIFNEPGREQVFADMEGWLEGHR